MAEYIDREAAINAITTDGFEHFSGCLSSSEATLIELMRDSVSEIPAADVAEVRHGRWLPQTLWGGDIVDCSECETIGSPQWNYCPVCGADMRGKSKTL